MRITQFTDYSLRVLLYLGISEKRATITDIAKSFRISRNHLVKVVHQLSVRGYVKSYKGKGGGIVLAREPMQIKIGDFVKEHETLDLLECFDRHTNTCPIRGYCSLERALHQASEAFLKSLNQMTLADFLRPSPALVMRKKLLKVI